MKLDRILGKVAAAAPVEAALAAALAGRPRAVVELRNAFKPAFLALLAARLARPIIFAVSDEARAREMARDIETWLGGAKVLSFSDPDQPAYSQMSINQSILSQRAAVLAELIRFDSAAEGARGRPPVVVASVTAIMRRLTPAAEFRRHFLTIAPGQLLKPEELIQRLATLGYKRNPLVEAPGEFASRGGIVDVFPPQTENPVRVDFLGDEIEAVRYFDPESQRSLDPCGDLLLGSASEVPIWLGPQIAGSLRRLDLDHLRPEDRVTWQRHLENLEGGQYFDNAAFYTMSAMAGASTLCDYCPSALLAVDEPEAVAWSASEYSIQAEETRQRLLRSREVPDGFGSPLFSSEEISALLNTAELRLTHQPEPAQYGERRRVIGGFEAPQGYSGRLQRLIADLLGDKKAGLRTVLVSYQGRRLAQLLNEQGLGAAMLDDLRRDLPAGAVAVVRGTLSEGWRHRESSLTVLSDAEIFGRSRPLAMRRFKKAADRTFLSDLQPGDFVVHVEYGIGRFDGIVRLTEVGGEREYLLLSYTGEDKLYVPVDQLGRIQRFIGMGDHKPKLSRLGTNEWNRAKEKAGKSARDIAGDLIEIYAAREVAQGRAFGPDTVWQSEMEDAFAYVETEDQRQAIWDVKADLEKLRPMDRLVCGDVGFGKTEVAIRAAFKAASDGTQVAMLVPTTILAQQHFDTFAGRMGNYPLRLEMLSRFRTPEEQRAVVGRMADGSVDIVIGTHRLLQKDVKFKNLGLVIVDEEQRFGVADKERLKKLRKEVDVLTLTATPIPRTLHMALVGVRDVSIMDSPPPDRLAVKTYVACYDDAMVHRAIVDELQRGGQLYYVHNRVRTMEATAQRLRQLVPEARFVVAHGQMPSSLLESVMVAFASGEHDVLVCSSIIENGMDLPNVNTMIVDECWMFGLAQLYQLRGRVGRAANQAYAYFLYDKSSRLTEEAQKRLQAILEASELGAGFRLAMRDLEIRGAGDLLGADQHGYANAVGFDLYCRMIADAVQAMQGKPVTPSPVLTTTVDLPLDAYLPDDYMGGYEAKIREYQRLTQLSSLAEAREAISSLRDRFGEFPDPVENLVYVVTLRAKASELGVKAVTSYGGELIIRLAKDFTLDRESVYRAVGRQMRLGSAGLIWPDFRLDPDWRGKLMNLFDSLLADSSRARAEAAV